MTFDEEVTVPSALQCRVRASPGQVGGGVVYRDATVTQEEECRRESMRKEPSPPPLSHSVYLFLAFLQAVIRPSRYCMVVMVLVVSPQPPANSPIIALRKARQLNR